MSDILRTVGQRIGQELALELRDETDDKEVWNKLTKQWSDLGMGEISFDSIPPNVVTVNDSKNCERDPALVRYYAIWTKAF